MPIFAHIKDALAQPRSKVRKSNWVTVYALTDARDVGIRYIGVTSKSLPERLARHLAKPTNYGMRQWLNSLAAERVMPAITMLEIVPRREWEDAERGWIYWCRTKGDLLNVDPGGKFRTDDGRPRELVLGSYQAPRPGASQLRAVGPGVQVRRKGKVNGKKMARFLFGA